ncbi:hypothetical protein [Nocardia sp. NPDC052566]|uniref:hypothetical protein n=1 Tax=Nocardia sp. NPDC052566 TaxID=3364330 RepID=UPI0037C650FD
MISKRMPGALLVVSAAAVLFAPAANAIEDGATNPLQTPEVSFAGAGPGAVTATVRNPNDRGVCWALAENGQIFGGDQSLAGPGATIKATLEGLKPGSTIQATGICAYRYPVEKADYSWSLAPITVNVPDKKPATGSFG